MLASNDLAIYTAVHSCTILDMAAPNRPPRKSRPPLQPHDAESLEALIDQLQAAQGKLRAAKMSLERHGPHAKVKVNYTQAAASGITAVGWLADDVVKKINQRLVYFEEGRLPTEEPNLPAPASEIVQKRRAKK